MPYTVEVVTGSRAEYGLLRPVLQKLAAHPEMDTRLVVTGTHLSRAHGFTLDEIVADGFPVAAKLDILSSPLPEGRAGVAGRTALALELAIAHFAALPQKPHAVLLLGDRYEILAASEAASLLGIPVVHISGGDVTAGADDDWFRHCITKMAKLHFPSCEAYARRLIRMGEAPDTVFNVGGLGDENIRHMALPTFAELQASLAFNLPKPYALATFHPETAVGSLPAEEQIDRFLAALDMHPALFTLFTGANADAGGELFNRRLAAYADAHQNAALVASLGTARYLAAMREAALVVGNSSSGVVETPGFGTPAVDIGARQAGRVTGQNVLHCPLETEAIAEAISTALSPAFAEEAHKATSPYHGGNTSGKIVEILFDFLQSGRLDEPKTFYDAP